MHPHYHHPEKKWLLLSHIKSILSHHCQVTGYWIKHQSLQSSNVVFSVCQVMQNKEFCSAHYNYMSHVPISSWWAGKLQSTFCNKISRQVFLLQSVNSLQLVECYSHHQVTISCWQLPILYRVSALHLHPVCKLLQIGIISEHRAIKHMPVVSVYQSGCHFLQCEHVLCSLQSERYQRKKSEM